MFPAERVNRLHEVWPLVCLASPGTCGTIILRAFINTFPRLGECSLQYGKGLLLTSPHLQLWGKTGLNNYEATVQAQHTKALL